MLAFTGFTGFTVFVADAGPAPAFFIAPGLGVDFFDMGADPVVVFDTFAADGLGFVNDGCTVFFAGAEADFFAGGVPLAAVVEGLDLAGAE